MDTITLNKKIKSLWLNGYLLSYIADKLNCSLDYVDHVINTTIYHEPK